MHTVGTSNGEARPRRMTHWPWAIAAAVALLGWRVIRRERARLRERSLHADAHRWEGEGGRVVS
jgi:hypothetical protein